MRSIQNEDVKTLADITGAGGTVSQLINDSKIYDSTNNQQLSVSISSGAIGGANKTLSNLTSPTAVNQHILAGTNDTFDLGYFSGTDRWRALYVNDIKYTGTRNIDVKNRQMRDGNGGSALAIDYSTARGLYDQSEIISVGWQARALYGTTGTPAFVWSNAAYNDNQGKRLFNVGTPTVGSDAVNKTYVDTPPAIYDNGSSGGSKTINLANSQTQKMLMTAACAITLSNPVVGETYLLRLQQDGTGGWTPTWFGGTFKWPGGTAPTGSAANKIDLISLFYDGVFFFGTYTLNF